MPDGLRITVWLVVSFGLALLFVSVAIHNVKRVSPAQFWPWQKVKQENLTDVAAYNKENASIWLTCAFLFAVNGVIGVFSRQLSAGLYLFFVFPGLFFLAQRYNKILRRYIKAAETSAEKNKNVTDETEAKGL